MTQSLAGRVGLLELPTCSLSELRAAGLPEAPARADDDAHRAPAFDAGAGPAPASGQGGAPPPRTGEARGGGA